MKRHFEALRITLRDPAKIPSLSYGEVLSPKLINEITKIPFDDGLFCQKIFGPIESYSCKCGRHRKSRRCKGTVCKHCNVEITNARVRRERNGHISLLTTVVHPLYRMVISQVLSIEPSKLEDLIMCRKYIVLKSGQPDYAVSDLIDTQDYLKLKKRNGFRAGTGGKVIEHLLQHIDIEATYKQLKQVASRRNDRRLKYISMFRESGVKPEWMCLDCILVHPPDLRPILFMEDGTVASSDLNDLYVRLICRNNRLKKMVRFNLPETILNVEKMGLQMAVDALFNNEKTVKAKNRSGKRIFKSLSSLVSGKNGRLRKNLLGKRVDYSGRSQIGVGPELKLHQCGLPYELALNIARPFVYNELLRLGYASTLKHARMLADMSRPEVFEALERVFAEKMILLNRAPSLHRMSFQAFDVVLINDKAIRLHPLVCSAYNADFDGDQMGVHLPLSDAAQIECRLLMSSVNNILSPAHGGSLVTPSQDALLGLYYLTKDRSGRTGEGKLFADKEDLLIAYEHGAVEMHSRVKVRFEGELVPTTPGRVIFSELMPAEISFHEVNKNIKKRDLNKIIETCYERSGPAATVRLVDALMKLGYKYATLSGISICISDVTIPTEKRTIIDRTEEKVREIMVAYGLGRMAEVEKHKAVIDLWDAAFEELSNKLMESLGLPEDGAESLTTEQKKDLREFNSVFMMADSGARGSKDQIMSVGGMRGLMPKPNGDIVENPIRSNLKEGVTCHEFLLACHTARKGRADGALKTATAGYFTRRLVDTMHEIIIEEYDCGTNGSIEVSALAVDDVIIVPLHDRIYGRVAAETLTDTITGDIIVSRNQPITRTIAARISAAGIRTVKSRSPITCEARSGLCALCYGLDLSKNEMAEIGDAAGVIAAQSIGEPGTQLTLKTFHKSSASVKQKRSFIETKHYGRISLTDVKTVRNREGKAVVVSRNSFCFLLKEKKEINRWSIPYGAILEVEDGASVSDGTVLATWDPKSIPMIAPVSGRAKYIDIIDGVTMTEKEMYGILSKTITAIHKHAVPMIHIEGVDVNLPLEAYILVKDNELVEAGDIIAKVSLEATKNQDITSGLQKILFYMDLIKPKTPAVLAEINGTVTVQTKSGKYAVTVANDYGDMRKYIVSIDRSLSVLNGDYVKAGDVLVEGTIDPRDILRIYGRDKTRQYIVDEVQKLYQQQGVSIHDKHFEILVRKMSCKVSVTFPGDTKFVRGQIVNLTEFITENELTEGEKAAAEPILQGLKNIPLYSDSWLSAASFQETARILAEAALQGRTDNLKGMKENIIVGNPMPAGTAHPEYQNVMLTRKRGRPRKNFY